MEHPPPPGEAAAARRATTEPSEESRELSVDPPLGRPLGFNSFAAGWYQAERANIMALRKPAI
jgi:hypothetical protein